MLDHFRLKTAWAPLDESVLPTPLLAGARRIVLLVVDAFGSIQMDRALAADQMPHLAALLRRSGTATSTLTSVFPSTTTAAFTSLNLGTSPAEHGLLGYTLWFREVGAVADLIAWRSRPEGAYIFDQVRPQVGPTLYERLAGAGVQGYAVSNAAFRDSGLTRLLHQGARYLGYVTPSSWAPLIRQALVQSGDAPAFVLAYWHGVDDVAHQAGPESLAHEEELRMLDGVLGRVIDQLAGTDTLLLLTADHGQIQLSADSTLLINGQTAIEQELASIAAGDRRCAYLRAKPGRTDALQAAIKAAFGDRVETLRSEEALDRGLFGARQTRYLDRVGDLIVLPRGNGRIWYDPHQPDGGFHWQKGSHGGMAPEEMLVPFVAARL